MVRTSGPALQTTQRRGHAVSNLQFKRYTSCAIAETSALPAAQLLFLSLPFLLKAAGHLLLVLQSFLQFLM